MQRTLVPKSAANQDNKTGIYQVRIYRGLQPIKAMTFDLDDTFYDNGPYIKHAYRVLADYLQTHHPKASALSAHDWAMYRREFVQRDPRLTSDVSALRRLTLKRALAHDIKEEPALNDATDKCYDVFYRARSEFKVANNVLTLLDTLRSRFPLVGITNGNVDAEMIGILPFFVKILHASVERPMKPHRHMFDEASQLVGVAPENILHVGDNLEKDVMGAVNAGFQAAWFAHDREMLLNREDVTVLPHIELESLEELALI